MPKFIAQITRYGYSYCKDIEEIKYDMGNSYEFKKSIGIKSFYDIAIHDAQGAIIGFVAVQWNEIMPEVNKIDLDNLAWYLEEEVKKLTIVDEYLKHKRSFRLFKKKAR